MADKLKTTSLTGPNGEILERTGIVKTIMPGEWYWSEILNRPAIRDDAPREWLREIPEAVPAPIVSAWVAREVSATVALDGGTVRCCNNPECGQGYEHAGPCDTAFSESAVPASGERPAPRFFPEVRRKEDMSPDGMLWLIRQEDGDIIVTIIPDSEINKPMASVEFCSCGAGGGRSPKTLAALRALMVAMEEDNAERKI